MTTPYPTTGQLKLGAKSTAPANAHHSQLASPITQLPFIFMSYSVVAILSGFLTLNGCTYNVIKYFESNKSK